MTTTETQEMQAKGSTPDGYVAFPHLDSDAQRAGQPALNRHSTFITRDHDFPPAKVRFGSILVLLEIIVLTTPRLCYTPLVLQMKR